MNNLHHNVNDLAKRFKVTPQTIYRWVRQGNFPSPVIFSSRCTRWKDEDVDRWEKNQANTSDTV